MSHNLAIGVILLFGSCQEAWGESTSRTTALEGEPERMALAWAQDDALPSIWQPGCARVVRDVEIRVASEDEWISRLRLCPLLEDGTHSTAGGCTGTASATATVGTVDRGPRRPKTPVIYLAPGVGPDGDVAAVWHELGHLLSACSGLGPQRSHSDPAVWGGDGIVWRWQALEEAP